MPSFFDKLKKGMSIDSGFEEPEEEIPAVFSKQKLIESKKINKKENLGGKKKEVDFVSKPEKKIKKLKVIKEMPILSIEAEKEIQNKVKEALNSEMVSPALKERLPETVKVREESIVSQKESWPEAEGELVVDVYQTEGELIVQSAVAGIKPEDLDIDIEKDILVIKGARENNDIEKKDYFFQECYWGPFSRRIILPVEVDSSRVRAEMREGVLTIRMPKIIREGKKKIIVQVS